jgi:hypothetical protein
VLYFKNIFADHPSITTNGRTENFTLFLGNVTSNSFTVSILGESVSIMLTQDQTWDGLGGYIVDVDHRSVVTGHQELRIRNCVIINTNCETVAARVRGIA